MKLGRLVECSDSGYIYSRTYLCRDVAPVHQFFLDFLSKEFSLKNSFGHFPLQADTTYLEDLSIKINFLQNQQFWFLPWHFVMSFEVAESCPAMWLPTGMCYPMWCECLSRAAALCALGFLSAALMKYQMPTRILELLVHYRTSTELRS